MFGVGDLGLARFVTAESSFWFAAASCQVHASRAHNCLYTQFSCCAGVQPWNLVSHIDVCAGLSRAAVGGSRVLAALCSLENCLRGLQVGSRCLLITQGPTLHMDSLSH